MDSTQNNRLAQINDQTLIIGVDIAKRKHVARAIDDRGRDLVKRLVFTNSMDGFSNLIEWANNLSDGHKRPNNHDWNGTDRSQLAESSLLFERPGYSRGYR